MIPNIFKAYDIRGLVGSELTKQFAFSTGVAFAKFLELEREPATVVIGEDMRPSSPELADAFSAGVTSQGLDVIRIGLASTDMLYFAAGKLNLPGAMFTASHNPAEYNGIKLCRSEARPIGADSGLEVIREALISGNLSTSSRTGSEKSMDLLERYGEHLRSLVSCSSIRRLKIVVDAGNGMAGYTVPPVLGPLNLEIVPMYFELDGTFPNHEANPLDLSTLRDLQARVVVEQADLGLAFDGDADRCFLIDEKGELVTPSALTALISVRELKRKPNSNIIYNLISSKAVPEVISENGGTPIRSRVGHSFIKKQMAETNAIFGGEHSGHFYFADFWRADSGMLAALFALTELFETTKPLSELLKPFNRYVASGEINTVVKDIPSKLQAIREKYGQDHEIDELDGITVSTKDYWFNVRASNTEPLLRLNVEGDTKAIMEKARDAALAIIKA